MRIVDTRIKYVADIFGRIGFRGYTEQDVTYEGNGAITLSPSNFHDMKMDYGHLTYLSWDKYYESPEIQIENGDILFVKTGSTYGKSCFVSDLPMEATINPQLIVFKNFKMNAKLFAYVLQTDGIRNQCELAVVGGTIPTMSQKKIGNFQLQIPFYPEDQNVVVKFLDAKCAEIDALTADIQSQIDTLEQYKRSVITEAVTKGLNRNVEMKESRIEWIGDIPSAWATMPIKYNFTLVAGATPDSHNPDLWDGDVNWITPADFKTEDVYVKEGSRKLSEIGFKSCSTSMIPAGSIIFSKRAPIGTVAINTTELCTNQGCLGLVKKSSGLDNKYYYYVLSIYPEVFNLFGSGTTFKEISATAFGEVSLPFPPVNEQHRISTYLDAKCSEIDAVVEIKKSQLATLDEYKKSTIYEYVTGKKEVPAV